ncbi:hypothetical protein IMSAGC013_02712 [Lachnospiraceae bacterium]|nr:hypothetical protein IMSAGC013_02712 [Lachnospiraceae bacterium]
MGVTGIGTVQTYRYNFKTGKLSAKDGSENEFISFFNEGHSGGSSKTLNGFDWQVRGGIRFLIEDEFKLAKISGNDLPAWYDPNIEEYGFPDSFCRSAKFYGIRNECNSCIKAASGVGSGYQ